MPQPVRPALSPGAVARRLGVAVETLRSWDQRYGLGPRARPPGAHRRYTTADLALLDEFCRLVGEGVPATDAARAALDQARLPGDGAHLSTPQAAGAHDRARAGGGGTLPIGRGAAPAARGLARCAIRLDAPGAIALLEAAIARDGVVATWQQMIEPALRAVGRKWTETTGRHVEVEHLLSWCVTVAFHRVRPKHIRHAPGQLAPRATLLACAPDEWHSLPLEALTAALTEYDIPVRMLGPAVPESALRRAVERAAPARVLLWAQTSRTADSALITRLGQGPHTEPMAAGPGWTGRSANGIRVLTSLADAVEACRPAREAARSSPDALTG
jgi:DNA-binding transcriptional MerR regulator